MVVFKDLNPEDQKTLLQQAREMIEQENIEANAIAAYKMKKKRLTEDFLTEIYRIYDIEEDNYVNSKNRNGLRQRFVSMTNYLYKVNSLIKRKTGNSHGNANCIITTAKEWELYSSIAHEVMDLIVRCHKLKETLKDI